MKGYDRHEPTCLLHKCKKAWMCAKRYASGYSKPLIVNFPPHIGRFFRNRYKRRLIHHV